jgi:gluconolactonase
MDAPTISSSAGTAASTSPSRGRTPHQGSRPRRRGCRRPDGTVGNRRNFAKYPTVNTTPAGGFNSGADGFALDNAGRLYVVSLGGVHVFSPKGDLLGTIPLSLQGQNIAFAGPDKKTLYIVGRGSAFKVRLLAEGFKGRAK